MSYRITKRFSTAFNWQTTYNWRVKLHRLWMLTQCVAGIPSPGQSRGFYLTRVLKNSWREFLFSSLRGMLGEAFSVLSADLLSGAACGAGAVGFCSSLAFAGGAASATGGAAGVSFLGSGAFCWEKWTAVNEMIFLFLCTLDFRFCTLLFKSLESVRWSFYSVRMH